MQTREPAASNRRWMPTEVKPAVSDKSPKPQEPDTDVHEDPNEPAFDWMKPKTSSGAYPALPQTPLEPPAASAKSARYAPQLLRQPLGQLRQAARYGKAAEQERRH
jgi:hypothetical protein